MEVPWHFTTLNVLEDNPCQGHIIRNLVKDGSMGQVLKAPSLLYLNNWLLRHVAQTRVLFLHLSGGGRGSMKPFKGLPAMLEWMDRLVYLQGCNKQFISGLKLTKFFH